VKWRQREGVEDASHRPQRLHATAQEAVVAALRETLLLPLDDLLTVTREFIHPEVSRSGLDRCLRRHGVSNLKALMPQEEGAKTPVKPVKAYDPGCVHVDVKYLPQMPDEDHRQYLFAAIDRATRWVYVELLQDKSAASAGGFLTRLIDKAPFTITKVLAADNGKEFTDRFCATGQRQPMGAHAFDRVLHRQPQRTSPDQTKNATDQWHDRTLQRPHRRGFSHHPLRLRRALRRYHQTLR